MRRQANSKTTMNSNVSTSRFLRLFDEAATRKPKASGNTRIANTGAFRARLGANAAVVVVTVAMVKETETEFAPGVTVEGENAQLAYCGRLLQVSVTAAANGPHAGAICRGETATV